MKLRVCLAILAVLIMSSIAHAQSSRIAFATDRGSTDFDIYTMREDGTHQTEMTDESGAARRPSYSFNGQNLLYHIDKDIWIADISGTPSPQNLTMGTGVLECSGSNICHEVDAGPRINVSGDFLIVFTRDASSPTSGIAGDIFLATVDVSEGELVNLHTVKDDSLINYQPSWCGDDHVIWSREIDPMCGGSCGASQLYWWELCIQEVDQNGTIGSAECYLGVSHQKANHYPSCNASGDMVAFAQSPGDIKPVGGGDYIETPHDICTMDLQAGTPVQIEDSVVCLINDDVDDTKPVWSPSGSQLAYGQGDLDDVTAYEIYKVNADDLGNQTPERLTDNDDADNDPDWGPAAL